MRVTLLQAYELLINGDVVAVPTETVYGLAASLNRPSAIDRIFQLKGRPQNNPLIIHLSHVSQVSSYVNQYPPDFEALASTFWPGALTLVMPIIAEKIPASVRAHLPTAAFRIPQHPLSQKLISQTGPLVMPSANLSGKPSSTHWKHVTDDFGADFPILDGGICSKGVESTILFYQEERWSIIRLGAIVPSAFLPILGYEPQIEKPKNGEAPLCPGQMYRHYAPKAKLVMAKTFPIDGKGVIIGFSDRKYPSGYRVLNLGKTSDPNTSVKKLYSVLRQLDVEGIVTAEVDIDFPQEGLWLTLAERLWKASTQGVVA
jgi:L-threonylcarbamoyladenylate synthase